VATTTERLDQLANGPIGASFSGCAERTTAPDS